MAAKGICSIAGCGKTVAGRGWCGAHWSRWRRHGHPLGGRTPNGEAARFLVDVAAKHDADTCLTWPYYRMSNGYATFEDGGHPVLVHRRVCEIVHGPPPTPKHEAAHSCGRGHEGCISPAHLRWATRAENMADAVLHGTAPRGERHGFAKLTEIEVRQIRRMEGTAPLREIGNRFGVSQQSICDIFKRRSWGWLQ